MVAGGRQGVDHGMCPVPVARLEAAGVTHSHRADKLGSMLPVV